MFEYKGHQFLAQHSYYNGEERLKRIVAILFGSQYAVSIERREDKDVHLMFCIWTEDDEIWHETNDVHSTAWLSDMEEVLRKAQTWLIRHAKPDMVDNRQCGWREKGR